MRRTHTASDALGGYRLGALGIKAACACALLLGFASGAAAKGADAGSNVLGRWVLNNEATVAAQPEDARQGFSLGRVKPSITIGGVPVPLPSGPDVPDTGRAQDPEVLRCAELVIGVDEEDVTLSYDGDRSARWREGSYRGMTTRLDRRRLTSRYNTLSRKVRKTFELRADDRLEVTVVINPKSGKKITYKRVFDRASLDHEPVDSTESAAQPGTDVTAETTPS